MAQDDKQEPDDAQANIQERDQPQGIVKLQEFAASVVRSGPGYHPIFDKFQSEHVTQFLDNSKQRDQAIWQLRSSNRWFRLGYILLSILTSHPSWGFFFPNIPRHIFRFFKVWARLGRVSREDTV